MTRLLKTAIIGRCAKAVDSSWIDMLAGLSGLNILRVPPDFCASAASMPQVPNMTATTAIAHDLRDIGASDDQFRRSGADRRHRRRYGTHYLSSQVSSKREPL